jgi:hypothetical protein
MALNDFRCGAQNSVGIGAISDVKAGPIAPGLKRAAIMFNPDSLYVGNGSNTYRILCTAAKIIECHKPP